MAWEMLKNKDFSQASATSVTVMETPMSYLAKRGSVYYFRRIVPDDLRSVLGKREIMLSLRTKDREAAKRLIPSHIVQSDREFGEARNLIVAAVVSPPPPKSKAQINRERAEWEFEQEQADYASAVAQDIDEELSELAPVMDAIENGVIPVATPAEIARAGKLLSNHVKEMGETDKQQALARMYARYGPDDDRSASDRRGQAVGCGTGTSPVPKGKGVYLDTDIVVLWAKERSPAEKTKDGYRRVAEWLHERVGRKSVELYTRADILSFKDKLLAEKQTPQNINVKLGNLRTLLQWAVDNDHAEVNAAAGIVLKAQANKRMSYGLPDLQALFGSPVYSNGVRPKQGRGEAAYWLPVLALFTGARMEELAQLRVGDLKSVNYPDVDDEIQSCWGLEIVAGTDANGLVTKLKNAESERFVPLHPELERLGFIAYVQGLADQKGRVFPDLRAGAYGRLSAKWGEWFGRYLDDHTAISDKRITFHSFRHTFKDYCRSVSIEEPLSNRLMGHKTQGVAARYGSGYGLHNLFHAMQKIRIPGLIIPLHKRPEI